MKGYLYNLATDKKSGFIVGLIKAVLFFLSLLYGVAVKMVSSYYLLRPRCLDCKVISVGNITLGGTGKTVLVEYLARYLKREGKKPAILTRGYKRDKEYADYRRWGDEPFMLKAKLGDVPVIVNQDRIKGARQAIDEYRADTVILDDGFQQWRIKKDLEILTIDAGSGFGNLRLLPRGIMREPLGSLRRADIFVLTKVNLGEGRLSSLKELLRQINPAALLVESSYAPLGFYELNNPQRLFTLDSLKERAVALFSGIADPDSFERLVVSLGLKVELVFKFPDHYDYKEKDLNSIAIEAQKNNIDIIITTEKDSVRLSKMPATISKFQIMVLSIRLSIKQEKEFNERLHKLYSL
jgi:tetraacyldisaccharide 4'-kinase